MPISSHLLDMRDHDSVYSACAEIAARWEDLGLRLSIYRPSVQTIRANGRDVSDCLKRLLDEWLERNSSDQPPPSWRRLCDALSNLNRALSEKISSQHQCECSQCTGVTGTQAIEIVRPLYDELCEKLNRPMVIRVAEYMYTEDAFTKEQLEKIRDSTGNEKEALFTEMESAVSINHYKLKIFATALRTEKSTDSIGKNLLEKYKQNGFPPRVKKFVGSHEQEVEEELCKNEPDVKSPKEAETKNMATSSDANSKSETNIIRQHKRKLFKALVTAERDSYLLFLATLEEKKIVTPIQSNSISKKSNQGDGVNDLLTKLESYVSVKDEREREKRQKKIFRLMEEEEWLKDTVEEIKQEYDPTPEITPFRFSEDTDSGGVKVFLSHKTDEGKKLIDPLYDCLKKAGLDPWKDDKNMGPGVQLTPEIEEGIKECSLFFCAKSPNYFESKWCKMEFKRAIDHHGKKVIFPVVWKDDSKNNKRQYLEEYHDHNLDDIKYHEYDPDAINHDAEVARCANAVIKLLSSRKSLN